MRIINEILTFSESIGWSPDDVIFIGWFASMVLISFFAELTGFLFRLILDFFRKKKDR